MSTVQTLNFFPLPIEFRNWSFDYCVGNLVCIELCKPDYFLWLERPNINWGIVNSGIGSWSALA